MTNTDRQPPQATPLRVHHRGTVQFTALLAAVLVLLAVVGGCSSDDAPPAPTTPAAPLMLSGPTTNIVVTIPTGWHQVINSANPIIPEMVAPIDCMGRNEVACATGLARIATTTAPTIDAAAEAVRQAVSSAPGVTPGPTISRGPASVGQRDGYRHRFTFSNQGGPLTAEVAAVLSGPAGPDAQGNHQFSVVLVWLTNKPGAPAPQAIDEVVNSVLVLGGQPANR